MGKMFQPQGAASPLTTKGDLFTRSATADSRFAIGADGLFLKANSSTTTGLEWASANANLSVVSKAFADSPYTALTSNDVILVDTSSGAVTVNLFTASGNTGKKLIIIKTTSDANAVTIDGNSTETINGSLTKKLATQYETLVVVSNGTNWVIESQFINKAATSYTPTTQGFGTPTSVSVEWRREGPDILVQGVFTAGTVTASEARVYFPGSLTVASGVGTKRIVGSYEYNSATIDSFSNPVYALGGDGFVTFGYRDAASGGYSNRNGSEVAVSSAIFTFEFRVPISGWEQ